jgi:hypothetical protein
MAPVIRLRPRQRARKSQLGAALKSAMADGVKLERTVARLAWGSTLCSLAMLLALQALS